MAEAAVTVIRALIPAHSLFVDLSRTIGKDAPTPLDVLGVNSQSVTVHLAERMRQLTHCPRITEAGVQSRRQKVG
jgi:hypothetical protein